MSTKKYYSYVFLKADPTKVDNYRGIALLETVYT